MIVPPLGTDPDPIVPDWACTEVSSPNDASVRAARVPKKISCFISTAKKNKEVSVKRPAHSWTEPTSVTTTSCFPYPDRPSADGSFDRKTMHLWSKLQNEFPRRCSYVRWQTLNLGGSVEAIPTVPWPPTAMNRNWPRSGRLHPTYLAHRNECQERQQQ